MSQHAHTAAANAGNQTKTAEKHARDNAEDLHDEGHNHGSYTSYITGFVLSVILTAIPFWLVMHGTLDKNWTVFIVMAAAVVQIVVHMVFFLHMNAKSEAGWSLMALFFTLIIVVIVLAGSLWVMFHLNANMMPGMEMDGQGPVTSNPVPGGDAEQQSQ
ncbi:cytochrome o ubiquinol oxidase subunit IV [Tianweitania sp. BSSL-BM11]|uniref:Cytochrome bo(3) ubiquinol oxidase subunit 4 n=1 Tax=Tianweitania aestuarii TaxID=2814886 RepID=A0ABS5RQI3_9HYPH|nr:cytochrome o ubiquinol oxidase subunit IV [Tianweitania aestuarii]MBS9719301.1 cytochrome o ubiquinol oxidase subunit IV [Tianweitania aestuarii]